MGRKVSREKCRVREESWGQLSGEEEDILVGGLYFVREWCGVHIALRCWRAECPPRHPVLGHNVWGGGSLVPRPLPPPPPPPAERG